MLPALAAAGALLVVLAAFTAIRSSNPVAAPRTACALPASTTHLPCSGADVTDRLHTIWRRGDPSKGGEHTGTKIQPELLGSTDRIDIFYNASTDPAKSTVLFAYRGNKCPDEHRGNPETLFTENGFHNILPKGGVFLDIGACYGDTAVQLGVLADQVIAFEPNPVSFSVLKLNSMLNPALNIHPHNVAVGDGSVTELSFTYGHAKDFGGTTGDLCNGGIRGVWKDNEAETSMKVAAVDVTSFLLQEYGPALLKRIAVVKIDIEGMDDKVLLAFKPLLKHASPIIFVEWFVYYMTGPPHGKGGPDEVHPGAQALFDAIAAIGYVPYHPTTGAVLPGPQNKHWVHDILCKPK